MYSHKKDALNYVLLVCIQYCTRMFQLMAVVKIYCYNLHVPPVSLIHFPMASNHFDVKPISILSTACIFSQRVVMSYYLAVTDSIYSFSVLGEGSGSFGSVP